MESPPKAARHLADKSKNADHLTVMIMRSVGRVWSFKISPRVLFWASLFFLLFLVASVLVINAYLDLRRENRLQAKKMVEAEEQAVKAGRSLERSRQQVAFLKDYIRDIEKEETDTAEGERVQAPPRKEEKKPEERVAETPPQQAPKEKEPLEEESGSEAVDLKDITVKREDSQLLITLKLVNLNPGEETVEGYVHIIAEGEKLLPPDDWTYPKEKLKNGEPVNFRRGQPFRIQRFKPFKAQFKLGSDQALPSVIKVLVYDQSGAPILKKEFEVSNGA